MGTFAITRELLELCCIALGLLSFPLRCGEEEDSGAWLELVREVELVEVWKKGKGVFGILLLLQKKNKTKNKHGVRFVLARMDASFPLHVPLCVFGNWNRTLRGSFCFGSCLVSKSCFFFFFSLFAFSFVVRQYLFSKISGREYLVGIWRDKD